MKAKIIGTGHAVPKQVISNQDFEKFIETSDEWIKERTGMDKRHIITDETTLDLGNEAADKALEMAGIPASDIEILIVTTATGDTVYPNMACQIQAHIDNHTAMCYDLNAACSGFLYAATTAQAFIKSGMAKTIMVVATEMVSKTVDYTDRSSCILFGDGAAAVIFQASEESGIVDAIFHADGAKGGCIHMKDRQRDNYWHKDEEAPDFMYMEGKPVYAFATRTVPEAIHELLDKTQTAIDDVDWFVLHQANGKMLQMIARKLGVSEDKVPMNLNKYGNTSSATIPILLDELVREGKIKAGDKIVMSGFGAGLTWGALLLEW